MDATREGGLLAWQFRGYPKTHRDRRNLLAHAGTEPLFLLGTLALVAFPFFGVWLLAFALPAVLLPVIVQGRTHRLEETKAAPFRGPGDFAIRLLVEQWVTFPRFVLSGEFARRWREAAPGRDPEGVRRGG